jgi:hypothetical protein
VLGARITQQYGAELWAGWRGVRVTEGAGNFSLHHLVQNGSGPTQYHIQRVPGAPSMRVKWPERKADHTPPLVPRSRMRGAIPPLLQYAFVVWCSFKAQGQPYLFTQGRSTVILRNNKVNLCSARNPFFLSLPPSLSRVIWLWHLGCRQSHSLLVKFAPCILSVESFTQCRELCKLQGPVSTAVYPLRFEMVSNISFAELSTQWRNECVQKFPSANLIKEEDRYLYHGMLGVNTGGVRSREYKLYYNYEYIILRLV